MKKTFFFSIYCVVIALFLSAKANAGALIMPAHKRSACMNHAERISQTHFPTTKYNDARVTYDLRDEDNNVTVTFFYRLLPQREVSVIVFDANCKLKYTKVSPSVKAYLEWIGRSDVANTLLAGFYW